MKSILFIALFLFTSAYFAAAQAPEPRSAPDDPLNSSADPSSANLKDPSSDTSSKAAMTKINGSSAAQVQTNGYVRPDSKTRFKRYVNSMFGPMALGKRVATAGWATYRNSPEEWEPTWKGFGRRFASSTGKSVIKNTTQYALDETFKLDSGYYRSKKKDFGSRLGNALISPVTARDRNGNRVFGFPRIVGTYTSSIVAAETWYPSRYDYKDGLKNGTVSLGMNAAFNIVKEFIWKK